MLIYNLFILIAFVECAPRPDFQSYEEAKQALGNVSNIMFDLIAKQSSLNYNKSIFIITNKYLIFLEDAIQKLNTIASKMPKDENPRDYDSITQNSSFLFVLGQTMNKNNFKFLNYSHHYRQALNLIEKYHKYLN